MPKLAINGGKPLLRSKQTHWSWPPPDDTSRDAAMRYIAEKHTFSPRGREGIIGECEDALANRIGLPHALLCTSGTMALYSAFSALGLGPGDELICPSVTFHATAAPALHLGIKVVLVDVEPDTGNIDVGAAAAAITSSTSAIVTNAMWGHPVEQQAVLDLRDKHGLVWIEDVSHAHFAVWEGKQIGTWGDVSCMSLGAEKMLTGGVGGALFTRRRDIYEKAVLLGHYLFRSRQLPDGDIASSQFAPLARTGYGLKLSCHPLAAAIILNQLRHHLDDWISARDTCLRTLRRDLGGLEGLHVPPIREGVSSLGGWYGFKPWVDTERLGISREKIAEALRAEGLDVDPAGSPPLHELAIFTGYPLANGRTPQSSAVHDMPSAERYHSGLLSLPTCTGARDEQRRTELADGFHKVWDNLAELKR